MKNTPDWPKKKYLELYEKLMTIRFFEKKVDELFQKAEIVGAIHPSIGQEAVAVGVAEAMAEKDLVIATHRGKLTGPGYQSEVWCRIGCGTTMEN